MPTKRVYYVDEFRSWHPYNSKSKHQHQQNTTGGAIACIETDNPRKRRKVDDNEHTDTVESGIISSFDESREEAEEEGGGGESVEQEESSWKIVRTMDYANDEDNDDDCDEDNEYYIDSSVDEVRKHDEIIFTKHHIDHDDDDGTGKNDNDKFAKTFQAKKRSSHKTFDERFKELEAFKTKNGHCDVPYPKNDAEYYSLSKWCTNLRQINKGNKYGRKLSPSQMEALKDIGFRLTTRSRRSRKTFEERLKELEAFKANNGNYNVPCYRKKDKEYYSLGIWCSDIRQIYKGNRYGRKLSPSKIEALKDIGFELDPVKILKSFDDWLKELVAFKNENGHCNVPRSRNKHDEYNIFNGLGLWCEIIRSNYKRIMRGDKPNRKLTYDNIQDLKNIGFCFSVRLT